MECKGSGHQALSAAVKRHPWSAVFVLARNLPVEKKQGLLAGEHLFREPKQRKDFMVYVIDRKGGMVTHHYCCCCGTKINQVFV